uniref:response regulator n=1 Tax=Xinfangfangia pollutisoli TaxID=2865960 RepID=UPI001CD43836
LKRRIGHMLARLGAGPAPTPGLVLGLREGGLRLARGAGETLDLPLVLTHRELADALVPGGGAAGAALRQVDARLTGRRILLIEDRAINRAVVESLLARAGAQVMPVAGGQEALGLAGQGGRPPDLILTDLHMPAMDGFDAIAALRRAGLAGVPVVALSADVSSATRQSCRAAGFDGFVAKPLTAEALLDEIARVLRLPPPAHPPGPSDAAHPPAGPPPGPAAVLDRGLLLRHAGGDPALAADWLGRLPDEIAGWRDLLGRDGPDPGVLHLIAGSAAQVGALALAAAGRAPDPDLPRLLAQLDALLAELAPDPRPPARSWADSRPSPQPPDPLALRLQACRQALAGHEMRGFDLLEALLPDLPPQAAEGLRQAAQRLDFRAALAGLAALQP